MSHSQKVEVGDEIVITNYKQVSVGSPTVVRYTHAGRVLEIKQHREPWVQSRERTTVRLVSPEGVTSEAFLASYEWGVEVLSITKPEPKQCSSAWRTGTKLVRCEGFEGHVNDYHWSGRGSWKDEPQPRIIDGETEVIFVHREAKRMAWQEGAETALKHAVRADDGITLTLDKPNPYDPPKPKHECEVDRYLDQISEREPSRPMQRRIDEARRAHLREVQS